MGKSATCVVSRGELVWHGIRSRISHIYRVATVCQNEAKKHGSHRGDPYGVAAPGCFFHDLLRSHQPQCRFYGRSPNVPLLFPIGQSDDLAKLSLGQAILSPADVG